MHRSVPKWIRHAVTLVLFPALALTLFVPSADAIPAWARKYGFPCSDCHTAWPKLNSYGRDFKINGYRIPGEKDALEETNTVIEDFLVLDKSFPVTARFIMRPYDKRKNRDATIRSFHEVEVMIAGRIFKNISGWLEIEAEDEEEFNVFVESGVAGFHPAEEANVVLGWSPPFWADPFETLVDGGRRMTRSSRGPLDLGFEAGERLRSPTQQVSFYGRARGKVFYLAGISSGGGDPEGSDAPDGIGRVNVAVMPGIYLGGYILGGTNETQEVDIGFTRAGFDFQIERGGLNLYGLVMRANDDLVAGGDESWTVGYLESFYVIRMAKIPMIVPLVRFDFLDDYTGTTNLTASLNFYIAQNVKAYAEWWQNIDTPSGVSNDNRFTVQLDLAF